MPDYQLIQCSDEDMQELKRLALAARALSDDDDAYGAALDKYDEHANPDQVLVLFEKIDQLTGKVGNMVCAKRQMDEELEIARDDLVIFKGALSALGEASKKLVVCASTTGGTAGPDQGLMDACAGVEGVITLAGVARAMNEFERVTAERDALQLRLTTADQRVDDLETQLDGAQDQLGAAWDALHAAGITSPGTLSVAEGIAMLLQTKMKAAEQRGDDLTELLEKSLLAIKRTYQAGRDRITDMGGDCDSVEIMMNGDLTVQEIRTALKPADEVCLFPQSCTTRCDCKPAARDDDIPDFSPGNGNKARRRAVAIEALKPENQRVVPVLPDDPLTTCLGCFGSGTVSTGIEEASSTICNECNGTGKEQQ